MLSPSVLSPLRGAEKCGKSKITSPKHRPDVCTITRKRRNTEETEETEERGSLPWLRYIRKNLKDRKQFPTARIQRRDLLRFIGSAAHPVRKIERERDCGDATASVFSVKRRGTRPNPRKLYQEIPESVNPRRGKRRVACNKLNSLLSTILLFAQNVHRQIYCTFRR